MYPQSWGSSLSDREISSTASQHWHSPNLSHNRHRLEGELNLDQYFGTLYLLQARMGVLGVECWAWSWAQLLLEPKHAPYHVLPQLNHSDSMFCSWIVSGSSDDGCGKFTHPVSILFLTYFRCLYKYEQQWLLTAFRSQAPTVRSVDYTDSVSETNPTRR